MQNAEKRPARRIPGAEQGREAGAPLSFPDGRKSKKMNYA